MKTPCYNAIRLQKLRSAGKTTRWKILSGKILARYKKLVSYFLHHRRRGFLVSAILVVIFVASCFGTNMVLLPTMDQGEISISVSMPTGSELEDTMAYGDRVI